MEGSQEEDVSQRVAPQKKTPFMILRNYREQQATVKKRGKQRQSPKKRRSRTKQRKDTSEEDNSTVKQTEQQVNSTPIKNLSATRLFEQCELQANIPYHFKENELDEDDPFDSVQRKNSIRQIQQPQDDSNEE